MENQKTMLIVGISSFVGSNMAQGFKDKYRVIGTYCSTPVKFDGITTYKLDVKESQQVVALIRFIKPDIVLYCVGLSGLERCAKNSVESDALNTRGVFSVANACEIFNSKFILFSSAFVYSGSHHVYQVTDSPVPNSTFGNHKASAEFYIEKSYLNYIIIRCSNIFGRSYGYRKNWLELIEGQFKKGEKVLADTNVSMGFVDVNELVELTDKAIDKNLTNETLHISSPDMLNRFEFSKLYSEVFSEKEELVEKRPIAFPELTRITFGIQAQGLYKFELDLESTKALLEWKPKTVRDSLIEFKREIKSEKKVKLELI